MLKVDLMPTTNRSSEGLAELLSKPYEIKRFFSLEKLSAEEERRLRTVPDDDGADLEVRKTGLMPLADILKMTG